MKKLAFRPVGNGTLKLTRWLICLLPLLSSGCFDSQSNLEKSADKKMGIAAIGRFFSFGRTLAAETPEAVAAAEFMSPAGDPVAAFAYRDGDSPEWSADIEAFQGFVLQQEDILVSEELLAALQEADYPASVAKSEQGMNLAGLMSLVLNARFSQIFSTLFHSTRGDEAALALRDDLPNPFTEAKQQQVSSSSGSSGSSGASEAGAAAAEKAGSGAPNSNDASKAKPSDPAVPSGFPGPSADGFIILGDFDGSGLLRARPATRSGDTLFISEDGEREFSLFINAAAAERQRAFYVDDMDGDGITDIVVTGRAELFGGVLLGDGAGGYRVGHTFFTGYEPVIPVAGPYRDGKREILTVNTRTDILTTFKATQGYSVRQKQELPFKPDYVLHLVMQETCMEYLRIAQIGRQERILKWTDEGSLEATADTLPADPLILNGNFGSDSLRAYQVGPYASVVLTSQGRSFNVANLRMSPDIFLVIGDLKGRGQTDVAVGTLESFLPAKTKS